MFIAVSLKDSALQRSDMCRSSDYARHMAAVLNATQNYKHVTPPSEECSRLLQEPLLHAQFHSSLCYAKQDGVNLIDLLRRAIGPCLVDRTHAVTKFVEVREHLTN